MVEGKRNWSYQWILVWNLQHFHLHSTLHWFILAQSFCISRLYCNRKFHHFSSKVTFKKIWHLYFRSKFGVSKKSNIDLQLFTQTIEGQEKKASMQDEIFNLKRDLNAMFYLCGLLIMLNILSLFFLCFDKW